jgi:hypothetical protein
LPISSIGNYSAENRCYHSNKEGRTKNPEGYAESEQGLFLGFETY